MALTRQDQGGYAFLPLSGRSPYSGGVVATAGFEIVHATLRQPRPWRLGFAFVERHLSDLGRPRTALCAIELRCARPYPPHAWLGPGSFNDEYQGLLQEWGLFVDGENPIARTNVAPEIAPPAEQTLYAFSYTIPRGSNAPTTFVVAGSGERPEVRAGETTPDALGEKTRDVMATIQGRLAGLGQSWDDTTSIGVYTVHAVESILIDDVLTPIGAAGRNGLRWYYTRPPITDREVELDARGVRQEIFL